MILCNLTRVMIGNAIRISLNKSALPRLVPVSIKASGVQKRCCTNSTARVPEVTNSRPEIKTHEDLYKFSIEHPEEFWGDVAKSSLAWMEPFTDVMDCNMERGQFNWFRNGKLNASVNCVDRHAEVCPDKVALIWERDEPGEEQRVTYKQLYEMVNRIANVFKAHGIKKGDAVAIYMPVSPCAVATMLACARIGAVHSVIFAGFSAIAIRTRIQDMSAVAVVTANEAVRGGKTIPLRATISETLEENKCPSVKNVFVMNRTDNSTETKSSDIILHEAMHKVSPECKPEPMDSEDTLFILYTSGSTGTPKGLAHSTAGYLCFAAFTQRHAFSYYNPNDVFGCVADVGWITGHSYVVYGPLANGGTTVLFESNPTYPDPGRYWETVQRLKINQFYGSPTAIRLLLKFDDSYVTKYDRSSLKTLGSVGEPINHEAWEWYNEVVGESRCDVVDTWWQTETGGIAISPRPSPKDAEIIPAKPLRPMFGMEPVIMNEKGKELLGNNVSGALCLKTPWPGIARTVFGHHDRYMATYFSQCPGYYYTGDGGHRSPEGYFHITGRVDDVINVTGHRLGTAEVEDALDENDLVAESAVVGYPHDLKGESVYAYIVLKEAAKDMDEEALGKLAQELKDNVKKNIAGYAIPEKMQICSGLPKTRSGKIMRRILRKVAATEHEDLGDISTLVDQTVVQEIIDKHNEMEKRQKSWA